MIHIEIWVSEAKSDEEKEYWLMLPYIEECLNYE